MRGFIDAVKQAGDDQKIRHAGWRDPRVNPAFVAWFGDSKVVAQDGTPLVAYHGTYADFRAFNQDIDRGIGGAGNGFNRIGMWFDVDPRTPNMFGGYDANSNEGHGMVIPVYLSIKNPLALGSEYFHDRDELERMIAACGEANRGREDRALDSFQRDNWDHKYMVRRKALEAFREKIKNTRIDGFDTMMRMLPKANGTRSTSQEVDEFRKNLIADGYDGIHLIDTIADHGSRDHDTSDWWVAFHSTQIKSVFNRAWNNESPNIDESA